MKTGVSHVVILYKNTNSISSIDLIIYRDFEKANSHILLATKLSYCYWGTCSVKAIFIPHLICHFPHNSIIKKYTSLKQLCGWVEHYAIMSLYILCSMEVFRYLECNIWKKHIKINSLMGCDLLLYIQKHTFKTGSSFSKRR